MPPRPTSALATFAGSGAVMIVMTLLGWSSVPLFLKHFSRSIDLWTSNGWRYGFSALLWAPVVVVAWRRRTTPAGLWRAALVPSVFNAAGQVCFTWAHYKIDPGLLTFGLRLQILFVAAGAYLFFAAERRVVRSAGYLVGAAMVFGGTLATIFLGESRPEGVEAFGVALAVGSGVFFAAYALSVRHFMHGVHPVTAFAAISQYTAAAMVALMLLVSPTRGAGALALPGGQVLLLLLSAVIGIALGHVFYYTSIARLGVAVSSGVIQLQPFLVAAASYVLFGERLTPLQWCGGAVSICGAVLMLTVQARLGRADAREVELAAAAEGAAGAEGVLAEKG